MPRTFLAPVIVALVFCASASPARTEASIPIRQTRLPLGPAGLPIYAIPVQVGSTVVEAGLDTGSVGLRVLPRTLRPGDAQQKPEPADYSYNSGVKLFGHIGTARLTIGDRTGQAKIQLIDKVGCVQKKPDCPGKNDPQGFLIEGHGLPGAGFRAIAGLRLAPHRDDGTDNPLGQIGAKSYIVDLPRRNEAAGRLVVDPSPATTRGFTELPNAREVFPDDDTVQAGSVPGCLYGETPGQKICGTILFDTGAPGISATVPRGSKTPLWSPGTRSRLVLGDGRHHAIAGEDFFAGPAQNSAVTIHLAQGPLRRARISIGVTPYFAFSVLYRPGGHHIAVRPRPPVPGGPLGWLESDRRG